MSATPPEPRTARPTSATDQLSDAGSKPGRPLRQEARRRLPCGLVSLIAPVTLYALDLDPASLSHVKWTYRPKSDGRAEGLATEGVINEGPTAAAGRVYLDTLDGHTVALDAETGQVL